MARQQVDIITCDRCERRREEADVKAIEFTIHYSPARDLGKPLPTSLPTRYVEVCARCDKLLRRLAADAATPSKPGRPRKEKEDD